MVKYCWMVWKRKRWAEYFEQVLNVEDARDANIYVVDDRSVLGEFNETQSR